MKSDKYDKWFIFLGATIFLIPLILIWNGCFLFLLPQAASSALLGILPYNDAHGYYDGAFHYLDSGSLPYWNSRRPIHTLLFSSELFLMNKNYWYAMMLQTFTCGLSCSVASYTIARTIDKTSGILFFIVSFIFAMSFIPTTLSETTGIALGMLAFVFIWIGYISRQPLTFSFGLFVLTLALHARAGPFFILPCLILLAIFDFTTSIKLRLQIFIMSCIAIIAATCLNILLQKLFSYGGNQIHSNFSFTIFGLVSGGKGWTHGYTVYPLLSGMTEIEQAAFLYKESLRIFLDNPSLILLGFFKSLGGFIKFHLNFFSSLFITDSNIEKNLWFCIAIKFISFFFFCSAIYIVKRAYKNKYLTRIIKFILAGFIGIILSSMIIWQDAGIRVFSTTYAFWAISISIIYISYKYKNNISSFKRNISDKAFIQLKLISVSVLCYYLIATAIIPFFSIQSQKTNVYPRTAPNKHSILVQTIAKYPYIVVHPNKSDFIHHGAKETTRKIYLEFGSLLGSQIFLNVINEKDVPPSFTLFSAKSLYILSDTNILKVAAPLLELNGRFKDGFFIVNSYKPIY